jgi:branched-chain amino acid transport system permease protein
MVSGAIFAGLISTQGLIPYALDKWLGISGNWALLFAGLALIVTLVMNPEGAAGAQHKKRQQQRRRAATRQGPRRRLLGVWPRSADDDVSTPAVEP